MHSWGRRKLPVCSFLGSRCGESRLRTMVNYERLSSNKEVWHAMVSERPTSPNSAEQPSDPRTPVFPSLVWVGASGQTLNLACSFLRCCGCSPWSLSFPGPGQPFPNNLTPQAASVKRSGRVIVLKNVPPVDFTVKDCCLRTCVVNKEGTIDKLGEPWSL